MRRLRLALALCILATVAPAADAVACGYRVRDHAAAHGRGHRGALVLGDSTGIFAVPELARRGLSADAKECRQFAEGVAIIRRRRAAGRLPHLVVLALGANGPVATGQVREALRALGRGRVLGLVTPRNLASSARAMRAAARARPGRVLLIDWRRHSAGVTGWFAGDGLHVNGAGARAYARLIARRAAGVIAPPARGDLRRLARRDARRTCGTVRRGATPLRVAVLRGPASCRAARALARRPPLRLDGRWRWWDWRPTRLGPWRDLYRRAHPWGVVATR